MEEQVVAGISQGRFLSHSDRDKSDSSTEPKARLC